MARRPRKERAHAPRAGSPLRCCPGLAEVAASDCVDAQGRNSDESLPASGSNPELPRYPTLLRVWFPSRLPSKVSIGVRLSRLSGIMVPNTAEGDPRFSVPRAAPPPPPHFPPTGAALRGTSCPTPPGSRRVGLTRPAPPTSARSPAETAVVRDARSTSVPMPASRCHGSRRSGGRV